MLLYLCVSYLDQVTAPLHHMAVVVFQWHIRCRVVTLLQLDEAGATTEMKTEAEEELDVVTEMGPVIEVEGGAVDVHVQEILPKHVWHNSWRPQFNV